MVENFEIRDSDLMKCIEQYEGQTIEDLFPNSNIVKNSLGHFLEIKWCAPELFVDLNLNSTQKKLLSNLKIVKNIGESLEAMFHRRGINTLNDLGWNVKYYHEVFKLLDSIENKNFLSLVKNKKIFDLDVSFCFRKSDFLFLDIETLGLFYEPIILVGLGNYTEDNFEIRLHFARNLDEEMAVLEHIRKNEFPNFRCFVTFNGKSFDIPYLVNRFLYFFDENPLVSSIQDSNGMINTLFHHIDLLHSCRRKYKNLLSHFSLTDVEKTILNFEREDNLPSSLVGETYRLYQKDRKKFIGLIKHLIDHNFYDIYSLPAIFEKLLME